jgi:hypothetical protein
MRFTIAVAFIFESPKHWVAATELVWECPWWVNSLRV